VNHLLEGMIADDLLKGMPANVRSSLEAMQRAGTDWNAIGSLLAGTPTAGVALTGTGQWTADLWEAVKWEVRSFLCTDSEPYTDLRREWDERKRNSSALAVGSLATLIGAKLGIASGVLHPLVTWLFIVAQQIGEEALCLSLSAAPSIGSVQSRIPYA
jgi:hypothetical protein